ncbi:MAG: YdcF family protein [Pseudomonadota bacterium]
MKILSFTFAIFFMLLVLWGFGWLFFATTIAMAKPETKQEATSAIIVLTGGNGRITEGLSLLAKKKSPKLFISGVHKKTSKNDIYKIWRKNNMPGTPCCVHLGDFAETTEGNAIETADWIQKEKNIDSIRLVTSSYHMPRASELFKRYLKDTKVQIVEHPVLTDDFQAWKGRFWELTFSEYNKWLVTKFIPAPIKGIN